MLVIESYKSKLSEFISERESKLLPMACKGSFTKVVFSEGGEGEGG